jgi:hypothetical protein
LADNHLMMPSLLRLLGRGMALNIQSDFDAFAVAKAPAGQQTGNASHHMPFPFARSDSARVAGEIAP